MDKKAGPLDSHYRCIKFYIPKTHSSRITDTVSIIPTVILIPEYSVEEKIYDKTIELVKLLEGKFNEPTHTPIKDALSKIADILNRSFKPSNSIKQITQTYEGVTGSSLPLPENTPQKPTSEGAPHRNNTLTKVPTDLIHNKKNSPTLSTTSKNCATIK